MGKYLESLLRKMNWRQQINCWQQDIKKEEIYIAIAKGTVLICAIAYLFYNTWWMLLALLPIFIGYLVLWKKETEKKKEFLFCTQFQEAMRLMAASLAVGYSVENAMIETEKELRPLYKKQDRIRKEFLMIVHELNMNFSTEQVLYDFAERVQQEDVDSFVDVFSIAKKTGGDSIAIIQNTIKVLCEKVQVKQEIEVILAEKRYEFRVMTIIPLGIIFYMRLSFPEFLQVLYGNITGGIVMSICLLVYGFAFMLGKKVIEIEV